MGNKNKQTRRSPLSTVKRVHVTLAQLGTALLEDCAVPSCITTTQEALGTWEPTQFELFADVHKTENVDFSALNAPHCVNAHGLAILNQCYPSQVPEIKYYYFSNPTGYKILLLNKFCFAPSVKCPSKQRFYFHIQKRLTLKWINRLDKNHKCWDGLGRYSKNCGKYFCFFSYHY